MTMTTDQVRTLHDQVYQEMQACTTSMTHPSTTTAMACISHPPVPQAHGYRVRQEARYGHRLDAQRMTYSINKITDIFQLNPIIIQVNAIEDFVQLARPVMERLPCPAEYGPGHASALFAGTMDALPVTP